MYRPSDKRGKRTLAAGWIINPAAIIPHAWIFLDQPKRRVCCCCHRRNVANKMLQPTGSHRPPRCCPLRITLRISTAGKSAHAQVWPPKVPFSMGDPSPPRQANTIKNTSTHTNRYINRFIRFCTAHAGGVTDAQTHTRYVCNNRPHLITTMWCGLKWRWLIQTTIAIIAIMLSPTDAACT